MSMGKLFQAAEKLPDINVVCNWAFSNVHKMDMWTAGTTIVGELVAQFVFDIGLPEEPKIQDED